MSPARGYTLIEVLIAVTVFSVLAASAYVALDGLSKAAFQHRERSAELADLQLAVARLDADLRQLTVRPVRTADGSREPALVGERQRLTGTRAGWANPAQLERSNLQRFSWRLDGAELVRVNWPVTDAVAVAAPSGEPVLGRLRILELRYRDDAGGWHEQWPPIQRQSQSLPSAIEVQLDSEVFGTIRRLLVLSP